MSFNANQLQASNIVIGNLKDADNIDGVDDPQIIDLKVDSSEANSGNQSAPDVVRIPYPVPSPLPVPVPVPLIVVVGGNESVDKRAASAARKISDQLFIEAANHNETKSPLVVQAHLEGGEIGSAALTNFTWPGGNTHMMAIAPGFALGLLSGVVGALLSFLSCWCCCSSVRSRGQDKFSHTLSEYSDTTGAFKPQTFECGSASLALPLSICQQLTLVYGSQAPGKFLTGSHGITHYYLEEAPNSAQPKIALLCHGLGGGMDSFPMSFRQELLNAGYRVLRYDIFGHGWSHATENSWNKTMLVSQITELLEHVLEPEEKVDLLVGHALGGVVGVLAASGRTRSVDNVALVSPCLWQDEPLLGRFANNHPNFVHKVLNSSQCLSVPIKCALSERNDVSYAVSNGEYLFARQREAAALSIERMYNLHPQYAAAVSGFILFCLRGDLLDTWRPMLKELMTAKDDSNPRICLLWGTLDKVVPISHGKDAKRWAGNSSRVALVELDGLGHESILEDPATVAQKIVQFTKENAQDPVRKPTK